MQLHMMLLTGNRPAGGFGEDRASGNWSLDEGEELMVQPGNGIPASELRGAVWQKSGYSNPNGNCVEVAELPDGTIAVRNSRHPGGVALVYTPAEITAFIRGVKDGQFDYLVR